ncbi:MAG: alpha/beta fold hydrolase BchO [Pseudomonadota bacterium]
MIFTPERLRWDMDGAEWPHRVVSQFERASGLTWHVQRFGTPGATGRRILLLHGTGGATHSWRDFAPALVKAVAPRVAGGKAGIDVLAPDLPGHAFTSMPPSYRLSLPGMAAALEELLRTLSFTPDWVIGHSAGAAIGLRMALDGRIAPRCIVGLNAALQPFPGWAGTVFPTMAKLLFVNPFIPRAAAWSAIDSSRVARLLEGTGSTLDPVGRELYGKLFRNPGHVAGALGMMANWDLEPLIEDLAQLTVPLHLFAAGDDAMIPPSDAEKTASRCPSAVVHALPGLGHLAHEEAPDAVARAVVEACCAAGVAAAADPVSS